MSDPLPSPETAARQFVTRLTQQVRTQDDGVSLRDCLAALIAESRREGAEAMRERCCAEVIRQLPAMTAHALAGILRALPLD